LTDGFSGADITELCQRAQKEAIKEAVEYESERKAQMVEGEEENEEEYDDPVKFLTRVHFETAFQCARKSVS
jgi:transitional endoplasmic reticulum ATPase